MKKTKPPSIPASASSLRRLRSRGRHAARPLSAVATGAFPPHENASGAIGAVKKNIDQQIDQKDVILGRAAGIREMSVDFPALG